ncbi:MAG: alkaline phosphatase [Gammaproteobacteria bacterium]
MALPRGADSGTGFAGLDASVGGVTTDAALLWIGGAPNKPVVVSWRGGDASGLTRATLSPLGSTHVSLGGLRPNTPYEVTIKAGRRKTITHFRSAPLGTDRTPLHFVFSGDLAGQNACRDAASGFPIFDVMHAQRASLFIGLGDMIYADGDCASVGPFNNAQVQRDDEPLRDTTSFIKHWRYNYADPAFQRLRHSLIYEPVWDDHEIVNDFGPATARTADAPQVDLLAPGREAFVASNPVAPPSAAPEQLYRRFRYGAHAEFFLLDTRQYRDHNELTDTGVLPKSLLGAQQRRWLIDGLRNSTATWKFIVSSVPISIPTGWPVEKGRDGWASGDGDDGFERELYAIFDALAVANVDRLVWLSADVHFATGFELHPLPHQPDFVVTELIVGPLSAGIFPTDAMDTTFSPTRLFYHAPEKEPATLDEALSFYNFGDISIDPQGALTFTLVNGHGETVVERTLTK